ncbi:hypothetical protein [Mycobacterium simiae]|uniref:hypothetical protein n=1 Tax=Mycobacterium simiae TaxID=1784 RepID=UPI0013D57F3E|nr:hypothetical protein [Mycobacterium simiae]
MRLGLHPPRWTCERPLFAGPQHWHRAADPLTVRTASPAATESAGLDTWVVVAAPHTAVRIRERGAAS